MIFDTHCHAYWHGLEHRQDEVRRNMNAEGVLRSVQIGTGLESSRKALDLARAWGNDTCCTAGLHPADCQDMDPGSAAERIAEIEELVRANPDKIVAIGETGLDYFHVARRRADAQKHAQRIFFAAHAQAALRLALPLVIHTRNAAADTLKILKEQQIKKAAIHCFSENPAFAEEVMDWSDDIYFSFSGILTYEWSHHVQETAGILPLHRILVETDAPYLVPQALRDAFTVNEPAFTRHVLDCLKSLRRESPEEVEKAVWDNSNRFYSLPAG